MERNELTASIANDELVFFLVCLKLSVYFIQYKTFRRINSRILEVLYNVSFFDQSYMFSGFCSNHLSINECLDVALFIMTWQASLFFFFFKLNRKLSPYFFLQLQTADNFLRTFLLQECFSVMVDYCSFDLVSVYGCKQPRILSILYNYFACTYPSGQ